MIKLWLVSNYVGFHLFRFNIEEKGNIWTRGFMLNIGYIIIYNGGW